MKTKALLLIMVVLVCVINIYSKNKSILIESKRLGKNIFWQGMSKIGGYIYVLGKKDNNIYLYSDYSKKTKNITKYFKTSNVYIADDRLIEHSSPETFIIYSIDGIRNKIITLPNKANRVYLELYGSDSEYYCSYEFRTLKPHPNPGIIRVSDNKILYEYEDWGIGYGIPSMVFLKDCFVANDKTEYVLKVYDKRGALLRIIKHPLFISKEYTDEERKTLLPTIQEYFNKKPYYPQVITDFKIVGNNLIVLRRGRPNDKYILVDIFNFINGGFIKTVKIPKLVHSGIYDWYADYDKIWMLLKQDNNYILNSYKTP